MVKLRDRLVDHGALSHLRNIACSYRSYNSYINLNITFSIVLSSVT